MATVLPMTPGGSDWLANQLQLILFTMEPAASTDEQWWKQLMGHEPAETIKKRQELTCAGPWEDATLVLTVDPFRVIWTITPVIEPGQVPGELPTVGPYSSTKDRFAELMAEWLNGACPQVKRMAFAGTLAQRAEDHTDAYAMLQRYLRTLEIDPTSTDFLYRINRKRQSRSGLPELSINRLSTWSAIKFTVSAVSYQLGSQALSRPREISPTAYAATLQLDVNTDGERDAELPRETLRPLLNELIELASEIASEGDKR